MQKIKATATLFLDKRRKLNDGKYPLKLTMYFNGEKKRYNTNISVTEEELKKTNSARVKDDKIKDIKIKTDAILAKADKALTELNTFSFEEFENVFFEKNILSKDLSIEVLFKSYIENLERQERVGTVSTYKTTYKSLLGYKSNLKITAVTTEFLEGYEHYMKKAGKSDSTIGIYLRQLRAVFNKAIEDGLVKRESYPFKKYEIPSSRNVKKALTDEQIKQILEYKPSTEAQQKAVDFWVLSYLCNGMNMGDILHLKKDDVKVGYFSFVRRKTMRTKKKNLIPIKVNLHPMAVEIIDRWKTNDDNNPYIFPYLESGLSATTIKNRIHKFIKQTNDSMEQVRLHLGFSEKLGTYVARHSFSTRLMRKGASTQFIKESLGHSNVSVTENYLGDFADDVKKEFSNFLTDFN